MEKYSHRTLILPFCLMLTVSIWKCSLLAHEISREWFNIFVSLLSCDLIVVGICGFLVCFLASASLPILRRILYIVLMLYVVIFVFDAFIIVALDQRLDVFDVLRFLPEWQETTSFLGTMELFFLLALLVSFSTWRKLSRSLFSAMLFVSLVVYLLGVVGYYCFPVELAKYRDPAFLKMLSMLYPKQHEPKFHYSKEESSAYHLHYEQVHRVEMPRPYRNIVLLIIESLSSVDSRKVSGIRNRLPLFDKLSNNGLLFTNFFANHYASEGGGISMLSGFPPLHYPSAGAALFREFANQPSLISDFKKLGYFTEYLTTTDLNFLELDQYLKKTGFNKYRGRDQVPAFAAAPQIIQHAPSDDYLYAEALNRIQDLEEKEQLFFLVLATASSHLKYTHPYGGKNTAEAVWQWVTEQMVSFYDELERMNFFEKGILIITGDHRIMRSVNEYETKRYGDSAKARIPLLLIGKGVPKGVVDSRFFQQADLFVHFSDIFEPEVELSPNPIWAERYTNAWGRVSNAGHFDVFSEEDSGKRAYKGYTSGRELKWLDGKPPHAYEVERRIHMERATHQYLKNRTPTYCSFEYKGPFPKPSQAKGLKMSVFRGDDISGVMDEDDERFVETRIVGKSGFKDLHKLGFKDRNHFSLVFRGFVDVEEAGSYWFSIKSDDGACLSIDGETVLDRNTGHNRRGTRLDLEKGKHLIEMRYFNLTGNARLELLWVKPGASFLKWEGIDPELLYLPEIQ